MKKLKRAAFSECCANNIFFYIKPLTDKRTPHPPLISPTNTQSQKLIQRFSFKP